MSLKVSYLKTVVEARGEIQNNPYKEQLPELIYKIVKLPGITT